ncbi:hypothetical protein AWB80_02880 [Caballeronia pedi]|uniref:DUF7210 domain-containing protein n=1 Tax=Caballeronia pedi TaxID=1777141 RepID=A0A158B2M3_9BURK|nr:hypothetical protein [Caballeronia pedi]SAK63547.1 hypothetical protein AWB80_02880 [Caballeronia pedi]
MKVTANRAFSYGRKQYDKGDEIEMPERDAKLLAATGRILVPEQTAGKAKPQAGRQKPHQAPDNRQEHAEQQDDAEEGSKGRKGKGKAYKRRDMTAEGNPSGDE